MSSGKGYQEYVTDERFLSDYNKYQERYQQEPRESDKRLLEIVGDLVRGHRGAQPIRILDIGCSTGNFLRMLKHLFPGASLTGADLAESSLEACRSDPSLAGIAFERLDMLDLPTTPGFDLVIANAVTFYFSQEEYETAMASVARCVRPGGAYVAFEWLHPHNQELKIVETSVSHPGGLTLHQRSYRRVESLMKRVGFASASFSPFEIGIDLPQPDLDGDVFSYTRTLADGRRLCFRGTMFQPWCYMVARK